MVLQSEEKDMTLALVDLAQREDGVVKPKVYLKDKLVSKTLVIQGGWVYAAGVHGVLALKLHADCWNNKTKVVFASKKLSDFCIETELLYMVFRKKNQLIKVVKQMSHYQSESDHSTIPNEENKFY